MMRSLFSAVSGLRAHQTRMDVIGNNIANVNTVSYKSQSMSFSEVFYQTTQTASGPNDDTGKGGVNAKQIGLGSSVGAISVSTIEGSTERTDNPWDLSIGGSAYFIVNSSGNTYFTRAGNFKVDEQGNLVTQTGAKVMGWQINDAGEVVKDIVSPLVPRDPKFTYTEPERSTGATLTGNINAGTNEDVLTTFDFYDSVGNSYQATMRLTYGIGGTGTGGGAGGGTGGGTTPAAGTQVQYTMSCVSISRNGQPTDLTFTVDNNQQLIFDAVSGKSLPANANIVLTFSANTTSAENTKMLDSIGTVTDHKFTLKADDLTLFSDKTAIKPTLGVNGEGAGKSVGKMTSVGVDQSGYIVASYSNGSTRNIGQIAVTTFPNPEGLEKIGDNMYAATLNSGEFDGIGEDIGTSDGKISSGVLEMSNVDLASEFTTIITTQRGYQANSRVITVSDTLLEELINLKR